MNADTDRTAEVVRLARDGDADAFGALYRAEVGRVYALCLRLEGDTNRAEELTQDVFVRAWERLDTFRGDSAFSTWLHRLAVNVVLQDRRAAWRRDKRVTIVENPGEYERPGEAPPLESMDLEQAMAALPAGARAVFVLHDLQGYRHGEIGKLLNIAEGTSKTQLFRARRLLREALDR